MFALKKPDLSKISKKDIEKIFSKENEKLLYAFLKKVSGEKYLFWDKAQYQEPAPRGVSKEALWQLVKILRKQKLIETPIKNTADEYFVWLKLDYFEELEHELDMHTGGELFIHKNADRNIRQKFVSRGILEEAIASSQLEGAHTSRVVAKKMIQEGRKPTNRSEQMILNNYLSLRAVEEDYKQQKMSLDLLLEMHAMITKNTLDEDGRMPHLRKRGEKIKVTDKATGKVYHEGPPTDFVKRELKRFVLFANDELSAQFIHPIVKAIMLHFWIGYLHPFSDGNGRLARLVFYWYLLRKGYWAFAYLPISKMIKKSQQQYLMAYLYTEQDDNDLTYFIDYNFRKIQLALNDFKKYLTQKSLENVEMKKNSERKYKLNIRQIQLLQYLYADKNARTNIKAHMNINMISKKTAITDLKCLVKKGFLIAEKQGRNIYYYGTEKIKELF